MKITPKQNLLAFGLVGALLVPATAAEPVAEDDWSFSITPYLWIANVDVETTLPGLPLLPTGGDRFDTSRMRSLPRQPTTPPLPTGGDRFDTRISAGAMLAAQARYRSFGLFVDFAWLQFATEALNPGPAFSAVNLKSDLFHATAALTYRLPLHGRFHADVLAGARLWYVDEDLEFNTGVLPGFKTGADKGWAEPLIGADLRYDLSARWALVAKGLVGGFGLSSDLACEVFSGIGYRIADWCSATIGYRYLHEDYDEDGFSFNLDAHGFLLGFGFHF